MKLALFIDDKKFDVWTLDFVYTDIYQKAALLSNAIQKAKIENHWFIEKGESWELFIYHKSKMK